MSSEKGDGKDYLRQSPGRPVDQPALDYKAPTKFTVEKKRKFLKKLERCGILAEAAASVGVSRNTVYKNMERDEKFKERVEISRERSVARLEKEMEERIYEGNEKFEYDGSGQLVRRTVTKDNNLLTKALEANDPQKWGKKSESNTQVNVIGDSAIAKLADFLKVDLPERDITPNRNEDDALEGDWEEGD